MDNMQLQFSSPVLKEAMHDFYKIPAYQRGYVWGAGEVEQLLADLNDAYCADKNKDYFVGSVVVCRSEDGVYELVDGQQRTTTFFLVLCSIRDKHVDRGLDPGVYDTLIYSPDIDSDGNSVKRYRLDLQFAGAQECLAAIAKEGLPIDESSVPENVRALAVAGNCIDAYLEESFPDFDEFKRFAAYVVNHVRLVRIQTEDMNEALHIFETINQRGVGLNAMDLLKNMVFQHTDPSKYEALNALWRSATDTLKSQKVKEDRPLRFLRYYLMATYDTSGLKNGILREDDIYTWVRSNEAACGYGDDPFGFVNRMLDGARRYVGYLNGGDGSPGDSNVRNITRLGGYAYKQHIMLLLAAKGMQPAAMARWKAVLESVVFYATVNRIRTNETERIFASWCPSLRGISTPGELEAFIADRVMPTVDGWKAAHRANFSSLGMGTMQQYRIRFILSRIAGYVNAKFGGSPNADPADIGHIYGSKSYEVEHIAPQKYDPEGSFGLGYDEYRHLICRLGNLTLLEKSINASIKAQDFCYKSAEYAKSNLYLTKSIAKTEVVGTNTAVNRINELLKSWDEWSPDAIGQRQGMLCDIAELVWGIAQKGA